MDYHTPPYVEWVDMILDRYGRHPYHNRSHALLVAKDARMNAIDLGFGGDDTVLVYLAGIAHDVVHGDEEASATLAMETLADPNGPDLDYPEIRVVGDLILDTALLAPPKTLLGAALVDADCRYLGEDALEYARVSLAIKEEYVAKGVTDLQWLQGRTDFLRKMVGRPTVFYTSVGGDKMRAKINMRNELRALGSPIPSGRVASWRDWADVW